VVVSGADARYARPLAVLVGSILRHLGKDRSVEFHLIDGGLSGDDRERILRDPALRAGSVRWLVPPRAAFVGLPLWGRMSVAAYDKLLVGELLDPGIRRALWIDADVLALGDVGMLWDQPLDGRLLLAAADEWVRTVGSRYGVSGHRDLGLDPALPYFNSGVMSIDLEAWRRGQVMEQSLRYLRRFSRGVYFWDQEALNAVVPGRWGRLDPRWNQSPSRASVDAPPRLLHFTGNLKPWRHAGRSGWHRRYYAALDETAWRGWRPEAGSNGAVAWYADSRLRRALHSLEPLGMRVWRWWTLRSATAGDVGIRPGSDVATAPGGESKNPVP
jgi:lipopolysaccharide biosynthesis glycosyltransferase